MLSFDPRQHHPNVVVAEESTGERLTTMMIQEHGLDLLFFTNTESGKTDELHNDPKINISFINSSGEWASISGEASIITDREMVKKNYTPTLKAWIGDLGDGKHDGGPEGN